MKKNYFIIILIIISGTIYSQSSSLFPMVPGVPVVHSPKSSKIFRGTPSIVRLPTGELLASNDVFSDEITVPNRTDIFISRDNGENWNLKATVGGATWSGLFCHKGAVYLIGLDTSNGSNLAIRKSTDKGTTWTNPTTIVSGACHGSSTAVLFANGRIYKAYEHHYDDTNDKWMSGNKAFIVSASQNADLMQSSSWISTDEIEKPSWVDGTGWLEANAVIGLDGKVKCVSRLASYEGIYAGYFSLKSDSKIDSATVGKKQFWGGASKFTVRYDDKTQKYWSLANYAPDILQSRYEASAGGIRSVLALTSSTDLEEWNINAIVLADEDIVNVGFQYVDFVFDGNDILFVSRTAYDDGLGGADSYHNANFMTFHKIENYATASTPDKWKYLLPNSGWNGVVKPIDTSNGKGDNPNNPIILNHPGQLVTLSEAVYQNNTFAGKYFKLTSDLDLNGHSFLPIGWYSTMSNNRPFSGNIDGSGYRILNLQIKRNDDPNHGSCALFGYLYNGSVTNIGIGGNNNIKVGGICGTFCAYAKASTFENCYAKTTVNATSYAGGIVGYATNNTSIKNCYTTGQIQVSSTIATNRAIGGIAGYLNGSVHNSYSATNIKPMFSNESNSGGIVGTQASGGTTTNSYYCGDSINISTNSMGISKSSEEMKSSLFVQSLNNGQNPVMWKSDFDENINFGYPILKWEKVDIQSDVLSLPTYEFKVYPNPCSNKFRIELDNEFSLSTGRDLSLTLTDLCGRILRILPSFSQNRDFDVTNIPSGVYLLGVGNGSVYKVKSLIISK